MFIALYLLVFVFHSATVNMFPGWLTISCVVSMG